MFSQSEDLHPRRHPGFPTVKEVKENPDLAYSDHLPVLVEVPGPSNPKILSYNILGPSAPSGLHSGRGWEDDIGTKKRYDRIVKGLADTVKNQEVDVILLQEATPFMMTSALLQTALGGDWEIIPDERTSLIACYNKSKFTLQTSITDEAARTQSLQLKNNNDLSEYKVYNVWTAYNPFPRQTENYYRKLLNDADTNGTTILVGDTNSRIAPVHDNFENITTGIVPVGMNELNGAPPNVQIPDHPDGGFYRDSQGNIRQIHAKVVDITNGNIIKDTRTKEELQHWPEYRMVLCLDDSYRTKAIIDNKNIYSYEDELKNIFNNQSILVSMAADCFNNKAIALRLPPELNNVYEFIKNRLPQNQGFQCKSVQGTSEPQPFRCVFAPVEKATELHVILQQSLTFHKLSHELKQYTDKRNSEHGLLGFFRNLARLNKQVKKTAVTNLLNAIKNANSVTLKPIDLDALGEMGSDLNRVISKYKSILPVEVNDVLNKQKSKLKYFGRNF